MHRFLIPLTSVFLLLFPSISISNPTSRDSFEWEGTKIIKFLSDETDVVIPDGTTEIGAFTFAACETLKSVVIPPSVTKIETNAFDGCSSLKSITIPEGVTEIKSCAFIGCISLTSVEISNSVKEIVSAAFDGRKWLKSIEIPNSVTSIEDVAFRDCSRLASVKIGNSMTYIGDLAFSYCSGLNEVYCYAENVPETSSSAFKNSSISSAKLYVPKASLEAYKTTAPWSGFGKIEELPVCATPTIAFVNGKCVLNCETENVKYVCNIEFENEGNVIGLPAKVKISVHATKEGYEPSESLTLEASPKVFLDKLGDINGDGEIGMPDVMFIVNYILTGKFPDEE